MRREEEPGKTLDQMDRERRARTIKVVVVVVLLGLFVLFILQNSNPVTLKFATFEWTPGLIWVMLGCALFGGVIGYFVGRPGRAFHRRPKKGDAGTKK